MQREPLPFAHGLAAIADVLGHPVQQGLGLELFVGPGQALLLQDFVHFFLD